MDIKDAYVSGKKEVVINGNTFFVNEIGYLNAQNIASEKSLNIIALFICESVKDKDGNKFTYEEVCSLKEEYASPLFDAVVEVNGIGVEKN